MPHRFPRSFPEWNRPALLTSLCLTVLLSLVSSVAHAGDAVQFEIEFFENGATQPMNVATVWTSGRNVRIQQRAPDAIVSGPALIYRGSDGKILSVSNTTQTFAQIERELISFLGANTRSARREVETQLNGLPKDQKKAFERLLGVSRQNPKMANKPIHVQRTGESDAVAGFGCENAILTRADKQIGRACIAPWNRLGITQSDMEVFRELANFQRDALGNQKLTPLEIVPNQPLDLIVQFGGLPMSFERSVNGAPRSEIRVRSVKFIASSDALFRAPSDYTERTGMASFLAFLKPQSAPSPSAPVAPVSPTSSSSASVPAAPAPNAISTSGRQRVDTSTSQAAPTPRRRPTPAKRIKRQASQRKARKAEAEYAPITLF